MPPFSLRYARSLAKNKIKEYFFSYLPPQGAAYGDQNPVLIRDNSLKMIYAFKILLKKEMTMQKTGMAILPLTVIMLLLLLAQTSHSCGRTISVCRQQEVHRLSSG
jgi:hypothetical protein